MELKYVTADCQCTTGPFGEFETSTHTYPFDVVSKPLVLWAMQWHDISRDCRVAPSDAGGVISTEGDRRRHHGAMVRPYASNDSHAQEGGSGSSMQR